MQIAQLEHMLDDSILTQRTLRLKVGAADVRLRLDRAAAKLRKEVEVPGFRKGKAPLAQVRKHHRERVTADAFEELRKDALDQVLKKLPEKDQPFLPPEVLDRDKVRLTYGVPLIFAVKYLVDPAGIGSQPQKPRQDQGRVAPGAQVDLPITRPLGIPTGPKLPGLPGVPSFTQQLPPQTPQSEEQHDGEG